MDQQIMRTVKWWIGCWVILAIVFVFDMTSAPHILHFGTTAALIGGGIFAAVSMGPFVYLVIRQT